MPQEGNSKLINADRIEMLRYMLTRESKDPVTYDEAQEIGESLIKFFEILALSPEEEA